MTAVINMSLLLDITTLHHEPNIFQEERMINTQVIQVVPMVVVHHTVVVPTVVPTWVNFKGSCKMNYQDNYRQQLVKTITHILALVFILPKIINQVCNILRMNLTEMLLGISKNIAGVRHIRRLETTTKHKLTI